MRTLRIIVDDHLLFKLTKTCYKIIPSMINFKYGNDARDNLNALLKHLKIELTWKSSKNNRANYNSGIISELKFWARINVSM